MSQSADKTEDFCGNRIGIWAATPSCPRLSELGHCRNCDRFRQQAQLLLNFPPPPGYTADWTAIMAEDKPDEHRYGEPVLLFRLGEEWLALPAAAIRKITRPGPIHKIPQKNDPNILGLTNIDGTLDLCFSLETVLGLPTDGPDTSTGTSLFGARFIVLEQNGRWVFQADEIGDLCRYDLDTDTNVPQTVANAEISYIKGVFRHQNRNVGSLDGELIASFLKRRLL